MSSSTCTPDDIEAVRKYRDSLAKSYLQAKAHNNMSRAKVLFSKLSSANMVMKMMGFHESGYCYSALKRKGRAI